MKSNMEEKKLTYNEIPMGYPLCFNDECAKKACCMHYQARMLMPENRYYGSAIYPTAWQNDECKCFCERPELCPAHQSLQFLVWQHAARPAQGLRHSPARPAVGWRFVLRAAARGSSLNGSLL